jgi:membrane protease YdiL (CAAX protease family)
VVAGEAGLALLAWALARWLGIPLLGRLHPSLESAVWGVAATIPLVLGLAWILQSKSGALKGLVTLVLEQFGPLLAGRSAAELALLAALAGVGEELLFRGVMQVGLAAVMPSAGALLATSLLFGLVHAATPAYAVLAFVMGLYLGTLFLIQGGLLAPITTHAFYDLVALLYVARRWRDGPGVTPAVPGYPD